jgi:hypothetical protein
MFDAMSAPLSLVHENRESQSTIMASEKRRRKLSSIDRRLKRPASVKPKDGDRRRRGLDLARLEQERKQASRDWNLDVGWTDAPTEPD